MAASSEKGTSSRFQSRTIDQRPWRPTGCSHCWCVLTDDNNSYLFDHWTFAILRHLKPWKTIMGYRHKHTIYSWDLGVSVRRTQTRALRLARLDQLIISCEWGLQIAVWETMFPWSDFVCRIMSIMICLQSGLQCQCHSLLFSLKDTTVSVCRCQFHFTYYSLSRKDVGLGSSRQTF